MMASTEPNIEKHLELLNRRMLISGWQEAEDALRLEAGDDVADQVIKTYRERMGVPDELGPGSVPDRPEIDWEPRPDIESPRWLFAKKHLGIPDAAIDGVDQVSSEILRLIGRPNRPSITTRGLVLGHVQSGKTTNFLSVAAKAADNGYGLVIVLAGVHNSLRRQTQDRAEKVLIHNRPLWWCGTKVGDFVNDGNPPSTHLAGHGKRGLLVVKKHPTVLRRLADWLENESERQLSELSVLVIDDEADQAGLDVSSGPERRGIHKQLHRIINLQTPGGGLRVAYVGYTATPYANILTTQDETGLYPKDFIYPLPKPGGYIGSEDLFGEDRIGQPIRLETDGSSEILTNGLKDAVRWFVLATAARAALMGSVELFHSSMLIHTTQKQVVQKSYRPVIEEFLGALSDEFQINESIMQEFYFSALAEVPARKGQGSAFIDEDPAEWSEVRTFIPVVLERLINRTAAGEGFVEDGHAQRAHSGVIVDNSAVEWVDRLTYSDLEAGEPGVTIIAIGGNTLSRGLTLEGLVCSYFARNSRTYDTLMQMGRWFGYRPGYRHLVRVWTTPELLAGFLELNKVEEELREELQWMHATGISPGQYGPRIRLSATLNVTRAAAMRSVRRKISYSDTRVELGWLDLSPDSLVANQDLAAQLATDLGSPNSVVTPSLLFCDVPMNRIAKFIFGYRYHPMEKRLDIPSLQRYLEKEKDNLGLWNVLFKSLDGGDSAVFDFGGAVGNVKTVRRSREAHVDVAFINSLVDSGDHRLDMGRQAPTGEAFYRSEDEPPLLMVYAIDPTSAPRNGARAPLDATVAPISFALVLPKSMSTVNYIAPIVAELDEAPDLGDFHD